MACRKVPKARPPVFSSSRAGMGFHWTSQRSLKKGARASSPFLNGFQPFSGSWLSNRVTTLASHRASIPAGRMPAGAGWKPALPFPFASVTHSMFRRLRIPRFFAALPMMSLETDGKKNTYRIRFLPEVPQPAKQQIGMRLAAAGKRIASGAPARLQRPASLMPETGSVTPATRKRTKGQRSKGRLSTPHEQPCQPWSDHQHGG